MKNTPDTDPSNIRPAATVILIREKAGKLQVYLMKRSSKSAFMAEKFVFPGGKLDSHDQLINIFSNNCDLKRNEIRARFGPELSDKLALAYCVAAIRETLEEAGVFLARTIGTPVTDLAQINNLRLTANLDKDWLVRLVEKEHWCLSISALSSWSHWITPADMKHRFDTRFFLTEMPAGQNCRPDARETVHGLWLNPEEALAANISGEVSLSPPTLVSLHELLNYPNLEGLRIEIAQRSWGQPIQPRLVPLPEGAVIIEPWDPMYHQNEIDIDFASLASSVLPVGDSFSRIWLDKGIWKPVSTA
jgi:8-oxo-dGTP pyrophosphatase MutT (NUDIX family)